MRERNEREREKEMREREKDKMKRDETTMTVICWKKIREMMMMKMME